MRIIDLILEAGASGGVTGAAFAALFDPLIITMIIGSVALYRWFSSIRGAEMAYHLAEAYRPEGVP